MASLIEQWREWGERVRVNARQSKTLQPVLLLPLPLLLLSELCVIIIANAPNSRDSSCGGGSGGGGTKGAKTGFPVLVCLFAYFRGC